MGWDLLFRGATLHDGTGAEPVIGDLAVEGGRIAAIGALPADAEAARIIDARGLVLAPGFIDIHTHSDVSLFHHPAGDSKLRQGVTTEVCGNCSFSAFPIVPARRDLFADHLAALGDDPVAPGWTDLAGYAEAMAARGLAINLAPLVGHGTLRVAAMGLDDRPPTADEQAALLRLTEEAMEQGAFGVSTGLTYVPSMFAPVAEIEALAGIAARHGRLYATHARARADTEFGAVGEAIAVAAATGVALQYSHIAINMPSNWGRAEELLRLFDRAASDGLDVGFDVYPYDASASSLTQYLPAWVQLGGSAAMAQRLADPETRRRATADLAQGFYGGIPWHWERIVVTRSGPGDAGSAGHSLAALAERDGIAPEEVVLRLCERFGNQVQVVLFYRTEADMLAFLRHPLASVGSDGSAVPLGRPEDLRHPRFFGTFPRVLGRYVREQRQLSLAEAIHKMTGAPAARLGLADRGRLAEGLVADLVVFDPAAVIDRATFAEPCQAPAGMLHVVVAGRLAVADGVQTAERPGRVLRRG